MGSQDVLQMPLLSDGGAEMLAWMERMRGAQPLWMDGYGRYHVFRYDDVQAVMSDPARFSSNIGRAVPYFAEERVSANLPWQDPPVHRRLRQLVSQAFTPKRVADLRPRIAEITHELIAAFPDDQFDFVEYLAYPLPVIVIAELLGISPADRAFFRGCADRFLGIGKEADEAPSQEEAAKIIADATKELDEYLIAEIRRRRHGQSPGDLLAALTTAELDGERLTDVQVAVFAGLLLNAGHLTTTLLLGNTLLCLRDHPDVEARVRADRSLVPASLEEVLRYRPPLHQAIRITTEDVEIAAGRIPANAFVLPSVLSANHDERQFDDPEVFDIHRAASKHLSFGRGIHFCLGGPLARLEAEIAVNTLFDEFAELRISGNPVFHESRFYGAKQMMVSARRS